MIRFSIVIPVYKVEAYLDECVRSVVDQTFEDFQIILVDDGSPDRCGAMCDAWVEKDSRITVVHQENGGLSAARNTGIRHAQGEYVLFLDSDDWWADDLVLEKLDAQLRRTPVNVLSFNYRKAYGGKQEPLYFSTEFSSSREPENLQQMLQSGRWIACAWNKAICRKLFVKQNLHFQNGITSEDVDWSLRLALQAESFAYADLCVVVYRQHSSSISHTLTIDKILCLKNNVQECVRLLQTAPREKAELLKPFVAYQYGTLLHNVAQLSPEQRSRELMDAVRSMAWLLNHSEDPKVRLLRTSNRIMGMNMTLRLLRLRQILLVKTGKGV